MSFLFFLGYGNEDITDLYLECSEKNVNMIDDNNNSPLIIASMHGYTNIVRKLLDLNADVNVTNYTGNNALHYAANIGFIDIIKLLVEHGINVNESNNNGSIPIFHAAYSGYYNVFEYLMRNGSNMAHIDKYGRDIMFWAKLGKNEKIVKLATLACHPTRGSLYKYSNRCCQIS